MANKKNASNEKKQNVTDSSKSMVENNVEEVNNEAASNTVKEEVVMSSKAATEVKKQEKPKSFFEKNKALIIIGGVAIVGIILLIAVIAIAILIFGGNKNVENPLVYVTSDGELKYITSGKKSAETIAESIDGTLSVSYSNTSDRYILYTKNNNLYLLDTRKKADVEKIASDVESFEFSADDKYIIYTTADDNLYSYNFKDKEKIDSDISSVRAVSKDKVFYKKDGNLYMRGLKANSDKVKIASDVYSTTLNEEMSKILYSKSNDDNTYDYYVYTVKSQKEEKVLSDVYTIYSYSDDFSKLIYGEKNSPEEYDLSKIVEDDKKQDDEAFVEYTYDQYLSGEVDYETWRQSLYDKYDVQDRNKIREQLKEKYELDPTISLYFISGKKKTLITDEAARVLYTDAETKRVVYTTVSYDTSKKIKMSEVNYFYKIKNYLKECQRSNLMFKVGDKDASTAVENLDKTVSVYIIENDFYYVADGEIFYAKISGNKLGNIKSIAEKARVMNSTGDYKNSLVFAVDVKDSVGDLKVAKAGKIEKVASDAYVGSIVVSESGKIYYFTDYKNKNGDFNMFNGKATKLLTDVADVYYVRDNYMYVFKDYSSKASTYDLYRYRGSKLELVDYSIKKIY